MTKNNVSDAFNKLISEVDLFVEQSKKDSIQAIEQNNPDEARVILDAIKQATTYRARILELWNSWKGDLEKPSSRESQTERLINVITSSSLRAGTPKPKRKSPRGKVLPSQDITYNQKDVISLDPDNLGSLAFTKVVSGRLGDIQVSNVGWKEFIEKGIQYALKGGISFEQLDSSVDMNIRRGMVRAKGFSPVSNTDISLQRMDANGAATIMIQLSQLLHCDLDILLQWGSSENARFPGREGRIQIAQ